MEDTKATGGQYGLGIFPTGGNAFIWAADTQAINTTCGRAWGHGGNLPGYLDLPISSPDGSRQAVLLVNADPILMSPTQSEQVYKVLDTAYCRGVTGQTPQSGIEQPPRSAAQRLGVQGPGNVGTANEGLSGTNSYEEDESVSRSRDRQRAGAPCHRARHHEGEAIRRALDEAVRRAERRGLPPSAWATGRATWRKT